MIFISIEDFYKKAENSIRLTRDEEIACAKELREQDDASVKSSARQRLIESYTPMVAAHIKRMKKDMQTLTLAVYCMQALEKAVDAFNFLQESETFTHRLSWWLRQATTAYIAR